MKNHFSNSWREECGVFGTWGDPEASRMTYLGLYALQHRGQESTGIVSLNEKSHKHHKGMGLVCDVYQEQDLERLKGPVALGHVRYSTTGKNLMTNAQPLTAQLLNGPIALAHNGNITNSQELRKELVAEGAIFQGSNDTECLLHLLARTKTNDLIEGLKQTLPRLKGAFSILIMTDKALVAVRDAHGFRPLVMGKRPTESGDQATVFASETCAFDLIGAKYHREIKPGEIFYVDENGEQSTQFVSAQKKLARCVFEYVYFSRPDSVVFDQNVYQSRKRMGEMLAEESHVDADLVVPVPDSGIAAALGYSNKCKLPFDLGIIRNHYVGRTFIQPSQSIRSFGVKIKLNPQSEVLKGKKVVVIDDSLVRGTTSKKIIELIRNAGASEVHFRVASPPTKSPCYYGVDTPDKDKLIASSNSIEAIRKFIEADSLAFLSHEGLLNAVGGQKDSYCSACFTCEYPV